MKMLRQFALGCLLVAVCCVAGCFSSDPANIQAFVKPYEVDVTSEDYILQPPDEIEIHCSQVPEIHLRRQWIRPDGKVSFEALGEIEVAGKTPGEVASLIEKEVEKLYTLPGDHPVDVHISLFISKRFYVLGQVNSPGPRNYTGRDSLLTALAQAQPSPTAWEQRVQVIRPSAQLDVPPKVFEVNYAKMIALGDTSKDVLLAEGDIVYVPPTIPATIAMTIEEFITPIARAFYGAYLVQNPPATYGGGYSPQAGARY
ncbi:MAG: polysaccharide biosynthesis/export family protein [Sedimentisphaerales bacterium]|nr:polysaccharide biosynthesis/export family protein [Sedimentisphaerales bacterium]